MEGRIREDHSCDPTAHQHPSDKRSKKLMSALAGESAAPAETLKVATWNVAAINNNPFEYWITIPNNPAYNQLMIDVEKFIESPGANDVFIATVFTDAMFAELETLFDAAGWAEHIPAVKHYWTTQFRERKIVSGFMKDKLIGAKRLASMPDRYTNTIDVVGSAVPICRPTVINMYEGDLSTLDKWWKQWTTFMFETQLTVRTKKGPKDLKVYQLLAKIEASKYPATTPEEEEISIPLQCLSQAIFDAILVHMLNIVAGPHVWQPIKHSIISSLVKNKVANQLAILAQQYATSDVICLQEVSASFVDEARNFEALSSLYHVVAPATLDAARDQNSIILLSKSRFPTGNETQEFTDLVEKSFEGQDPPVKSPLSNGDLLLINAVDAKGEKYVIGSFHGDTNGQATIPVLRAIKSVLTTTEGLADHKPIFGFDANTHEKKDKDNEGVVEFAAEYCALGYSSNWGDEPRPDNYTTFCVRTFLQPQLNKACRSDEKRSGGGLSPKDFILFDAKDWEVVSTLKDNTGKREYVEDMPFPTLDWPSDHGLVWGEFSRKA